MKKLVVFTALVSLVTLASFWGGKQVCMRMAAVHSAGWYSIAGLSAEQTAALKKLDVSFRKEADNLCMTICRERLELVDLMKSDAGQETIYQKIDKIADLQTLLDKRIATHMLDVKQNLTPAQQKTYLERFRKQTCQTMQGF